MKFDSITEHTIGTLVDRFYVKVRRDAVLAPIFENALEGHWDAHIATMREFWCAALRVKRGYFGDMLDAHQRLGELPRTLFFHWLTLFGETADECFAEAPAKIIRDRAVKTARNLKSALGGTKDSLGRD